MINKLSKSYKLLFGLSDGLFALTSLFEKAMKDKDLEALSEMPYEIHVIRDCEKRIKAVFRDAGSRNCLKQVDVVLYKVECLAYNPERCVAPGNSKAAIEELNNAAERVRELAFKSRPVESGSAEKGGGQARLEGYSQVLLPAAAR